MTEPAENYLERDRQRAWGIEAAYLGATVILAVITELTVMLPESLRMAHDFWGKFGGCFMDVATVAEWIAMMAIEWRHRHRKDKQIRARRIGWTGQALTVSLASEMTAALHPHRWGALAMIVILNVLAAGCWHVWIRVNALTPEQQAEHDRMVHEYEAMMYPLVVYNHRSREFEAAVAPYRIPLPGSAAPTIRPLEWNIPTGRHEPKVYFIVHGSRIKIGTTTDIRKRVRALSLRMDNVALLVDGGVEMEHFYHAKFKAFRIGDTEWFTNHAELVKWIASRQNGGL